MAEIHLDFADVGFADSRRMIDRAARVRMADAIRAFMDERSTAFEFDEALTEIANGTSDSTVRAVSRLLWFHYDDCKDHKIVSTKVVWGYFSRLLLLLESDATLKTIKLGRNWNYTQGIAGLLLILYLVLAWRAGFDEFLFILAIPFGFVSMFLAWIRSRDDSKVPSANEIALMPFPSFRSLSATRRRVPGFVKRKYHKEIGVRRIREPLMETLTWAWSGIAWCMFSPIALAFQTLPKRLSEDRISFPEHVSTGELRP